MSPETQSVLDLLGFIELGSPRQRPDLMQYRSRDALPDIIIEIKCDADPTEVREAIYRAGAACQREVIRNKFNDAVNSFRSGKYVATLDGLIGLADPILPEGKTDVSAE